jgi:uncharacterized protein DUF3237
MPTTRTTEIGTEYLMTLHTPGAGPPVQVDSSLMIFRAGAEGWAKGPKINGAIIQPTADWLRVMPAGSLRIDVRMTIRTDDGAFVYVSYNGVVSVTRENFERMAKGDVLTAADMYFIIAPTFETAHEKYTWLNHIQAIGKVAAVKGGEGGFVTYDLFVAS